MEHAQAFNLGQPIEVVVLRQQRCTTQPGQLNELGVYLWGSRKVQFQDFADHVIALFEDIDSGQPAAATAALDGVCGVSDALQFLKDECRSHEPALNESGLDDIDNPSVNQR